ncbi:hypothetical protein ACFC0D_33315 [Streptomyces sp. NPDC056222]|uniref:hypothetical protein n=1 Tax=Streptomyces sp. NPDC056222 TaxID=3345749 RepID=UPI0035D95C1F
MHGPTPGDQITRLGEPPGNHGGPEPDGERQHHLRTLHDPQGRRLGPEQRERGDLPTPLHGPIGDGHDEGGDADDEAQDHTGGEEAADDGELGEGFDDDADGLDLCEGGDGADGVECGADGIGIGVAEENQRGVSRELIGGNQGGWDQYIRPEGRRIEHAEADLIAWDGDAELPALEVEREAAAGLCMRIRQERRIAQSENLSVDAATRPFDEVTQLGTRGDYSVERRSAGAVRRCPGGNSGRVCSHAFGLGHPLGLLRCERLACHVVLLYRRCTSADLVELDQHPLGQRGGEDEEDESGDHAQGGTRLHFSAAHRKRQRE